MNAAGAGPPGRSSRLLVSLDPRSAPRSHDMGSNQPIATEPSGPDTLAEPFDRGPGASRAVRDAERLQPDLDNAQRAQDHRRIDMTHMGDPKRLTDEFADAGSEHEPALLLAKALQRDRIVATRYRHRRDGVGALSGFRDVEAERLALGPVRNRAAHRLGEQAVAPERVVEPFGEQHVEGLAQREQQMDRRRAGIFAVVLGAVALGPVPVRRAQSGVAMLGEGALIGGDEAEAGWRHQAFLRAGHRDIDAPG